MSKLGWIILAVIVIAALALLYLAFALRQPHSGTIDNLLNPFDFATSTPTLTQDGQLPIALPGGGVLYVPDFTKEEQPEVAGPETGFQVAGAVEAQYQILYFPDQSYFLISLFSEPLGEVRTAAEQDLRVRLGLTDEQLCALNLEVRTDAETSETFAGTNLGLSFCLGAVRLP